MVTLLRLIKFFFFISVLFSLGGFSNYVSLCEEESLKNIIKEEESETEKPLLNRKYWILGGILTGAALAILFYFFPFSVDNVPNSDTGDVRGMGSSGSIAPATSLGLAAASATSAGLASATSAGTSVLTPEVLKALVHRDLLTLSKYSLLTTVAISQIYKAYPLLEPSKHFKMFDLYTFKYPDLSFIVSDMETVKTGSHYNVCESFDQLASLIQTNGIEFEYIPFAVLGLLYKSTMIFKTLGYSNILSAYIMESCKYMSQFKSIHGLDRLAVEDIYIILNCMHLDASHVLAILKYILNCACFLPEYHSFASSFPREILEDFVVNKYKGDIGEVPWYIWSLSRDILKIFLKMENRNFLVMEHVDMHKIFFHSYLTTMRERYLSSIGIIF